MLRLATEIPKFWTAPSVKDLILHVTNVCNMRCQHCFVDFETHPKDLTLEEFRQVAFEVNDLIWLNVGGGEPFLRRDLVDICSLFRFEELGIPTNGWFQERVIDTVTELAARTPGRVLISVSLDGFEPTHDDIRQKGSFRRAVETFRALKKIPNIRVKINTVLVHRNVGELLPFMNHVRDDLGPDFHSILLLRGNPINPAFELPPLETLRTIGKEIVELQQRYSYGRAGILATLQRNYQSLKWNIALDTLEQQTQVIPCLGGRAHLVVYANGDVAPCEILPPVGNLRRSPLKHILNGEAFHRAVEGIRRKDCHCTHDCNMMENVIFNPRTYPRLLGLA